MGRLESCLVGAGAGRILIPEALFWADVWANQGLYILLGESLISETARIFGSRAVGGC